MQARRAARELAFILFSQFEKNITKYSKEDLENIILKSVRILTSNAGDELKITVGALVDMKNRIDDYEAEHEINLNRPLDVANLPVPLPMTSDMAGRIEEMIDIAEKALLAEGVDILYGVSLVSACTENGKITHAIVEGKSGRYAIGAKSYVDASGDADLAERAGAPTARFKHGNVVSAWYYYYDKSGYGLRMLGAVDLLPGMVPPEQLSKRRFSGLEDDDISAYMTLSHDKLFSTVLEKREKDETHIPVSIASIPQLRMTRRIVGEYTFTLSDERKEFEDSVGLYPNWRERGPVYELPFRTLYSAQIKNLACAGRCISTDDEMWEISRVIPCCSVMGEAAGIAAALSDDFTALDVKEIQKVLRARGVKLHEKELPPLA